MSKIAIFGASRGVGKSLVECIHTECPRARLLLISRNETDLRAVAGVGDETLPLDLTSPGALELSLKALNEFSPEKIFYVAGGGPYGRYEDKQWKDHFWALKLNFLFPAELLHTLMNQPQTSNELKQFIIVGSAIAGQQPDPMAASYAAAKHGLRGLITSIQQEKPTLDIKIHEPGYLDTSLLPANAWPRQQGLVKSAADEARKLWQVSQSQIF